MGRYLLWSWRTVLMGLVLGLGAAAVPAQEQGEPNRVKLEVGRSKVVKSPWPVTRVSVADAEVADVQVLTPNEVLVVGKRIGVTDLVLWNEKGDTWEAVVDVELDLRRFERELADYFPTATLSLSKSNDVVVVRGVLRRVEDSAHLEKILTNVLNDAEGKKFVNLTGVAGVQQVMVKVKIAEASRSALRNLGFDIQYGGERFLGSSRPTGNLGVPSYVPSGFAPADPLAGTIKSVAPPSISPSSTLFGFFPQADLAVAVEALVDNQYLRILAEPTLVALSGEEASFLAGGEFPIPVPQGGGGGSQTITVEYKEFGVRLSFRPTVLGDGKIRLKIAPEVSELSEVGAFELGGFTVRSITTRRAETTLEMNSGQTFAMAGLMNNHVRSQAKKVPGLGDLPVLGTFFRSVRYERGETELIVLATVELVEPLTIANGEGRPVPGDQHIEPSDWELYIGGRLEGKTPEAASPEQSEAFKVMGLDHLQGPGAWERHGQPPAKSRATRPARRQPTAQASENTTAVEVKALEQAIQEEGHD